jgi:hypothetical protein
MTINTRFNRHLIICISILCGIGFSNSTLAAATLCSAPGAHPDGLSVDDVTFGTSLANDCYGVVVDNDNASNIWSTTGWTFLAKDNTPDGSSPDPLSGTVSGITFTLNAEPEGGAEFGTWTLSWSQTGLPGYNLTMDLIAVIKASDRFASYLFEDLAFTTNGNGGGDWKVAYKKPAGPNLITPDLSHLSIYYRDPIHTDPCTSNCGGGGTGTGVPEPSVLALLGIGLLGVGLNRANKKV